MKIAFDLDRVFVNHPPLMPNRLIDFFYKKKNGHLSYRIPGKIEQQIRVFSHNSFLRTPIKENIDNLSTIAKNNKIDIYLVSGRFGFLRKKTRQWLKQHNFSSFFKDLFFNFNNEQPHLYKDKIIKNLKIEKYVDDDLDLLTFLAENNPVTQFYWLNKSKKKKKFPFKNLHKIKDLEELNKKYLNK